MPTHVLQLQVTLFDCLGTARAVLKQTCSMLCSKLLLLSSFHVGSLDIFGPIGFSDLGFQCFQASEEYIKTRQQSIVNGDIKGEAPAPEAGQKITLWLSLKAHELHSFLTHFDPLSISKFRHHANIASQVLDARLKLFIAHNALAFAAESTMAHQELNHAKH